MYDTSLLLALCLSWVPNSVVAQLACRAHYACIAFYKWLMRTWVA